MPPPQYPEPNYLVVKNNASAKLASMCADYKFAITRKSISRLLIAAILLAVFVPAHYHLHHLYNDDTFNSTSTHAHVIDLHVLIEKSGQTHHDEATSIAATPDGIVKKSNPDFLPFILLTVLLILPVLSKPISLQFNYTIAGVKRRYSHFIPLLRAPPLI